MHDCSFLVETMSNFEDYDKKSLSYDKGGRYPVCVDQILEHIPAECSLLDAGCGTGNYMVPLVNSGKLSRYTGFDGSAGMIAKIRVKSNLLRENKDLKTEIAEIQQVCLPKSLPYGNNDFDMILHNQVMHHIVDPDQKDKFAKVKTYLAEFHRVLKPGGVLTINTCTHSQLAAQWYFKGMPGVLAKQKSIYPSDKQIIQLLLEAGFKNVSSHTDHTPYLGESYFHYKNCFTKEFREADSVWACANQQETAELLDKMKVILSDEEQRARFDEQVRKEIAAVGTTTQIFARK